MHIDEYLQKYIKCDTRLLRQMDTQESGGFVLLARASLLVLVRSGLVRGPDLPEELSSLLGAEHLD